MLSLLSLWCQCCYCCDCCYCHVVIVCSYCHGCYCCHYCHCCDSCHCCHWYCDLFVNAMKVIICIVVEIAIAVHYYSCCFFLWSSCYTCYHCYYSCYCHGCCCSSAHSASSRSYSSYYICNRAQQAPRWPETVFTNVQAVRAIHMSRIFTENDAGKYIINLWSRTGPLAMH